MFLRLLITFVLAMCVAVGGDAAKRRTVDAVKKEQKSSQRKIKETTRRLNDNKSATRKNLHRLNVIKGEIMQKEKEINSTKAEIDSLDVDIRVAHDSISGLNKQLNHLQTVYVKTLRKLQGTQMVTNELGFIFSSESFSKAFARIRYVKEFDAWRKRQAELILATKADVEQQQQHLSTLQSQRKESLNTLDADRLALKTKQTEANKLADKLKRDRSQLEKALKAEKKRLRNIDNEITQMIKEEQKARERQRAAKKQKSQTNKQSKKSSSKSQSGGKMMAQVQNDDVDAELTARFAANKGRMVFPVSGSYTIVAKYGVVVEPKTGLQTNNTGVEIVLNSSATARCVFDGLVSRIYKTREGTYAVMVRHGSYITVYYNIAAPAVKAGEKVKSGQSIGTAARDERYDGKPMLHFEVRMGSKTYNPLSWVK